MYYTSFTLEHWGKYMDYTWRVSTPTSSSGKPLMSVGAVRHRFVVAVFVVVFCPCWCRIHLWVLLPEKRFNVHVISGRLSLVSLVGFVCGPRSRKMDEWLSLHLCCIVVKATQVLQSSLVAKLVLILGDKQRNKKRYHCCYKQEQTQVVLI